MLRKILAAVAVAAVVATPCVAGASTITFTLNGTSQWADAGQDIPPLNLSGLLSGEFDGPSVPVPYPATVLGMDYSVAVGADRLVAGIQSTPGDKGVVGISQGAIAIAEAKRRLVALPADQRPAPGELRFIAVADPTRPGHGALAQAGYQTPDTPYDTTYITREYDGLADLPDRFNVLAILNATAGIAYVHIYYGELPDGIPARNITTTVNSSGGTVTDILIPNAHLPLLQPLRDLGFNMNGVETMLRPMVDAGYSRNDVTPAGDSGKTTAVKTTSVKTTSTADPVSPQPQPAGEPEKSRRNVQASDARHDADDAKPVAVKDVDRHEKADGDDQADQPAEEPADEPKSDPGDGEGGETGDE